MGLITSARRSKFLGTATTRARARTRVILTLTLTPGLTRALPLGRAGARNNTRIILLPQQARIVPGGGGNNAARLELSEGYG